MQVRKLSGRWPVLFLAGALALLSAGCNRVSTETATAEFAKAEQAKANGQYTDALKSYQTAANGTVAQPGRPPIPTEQLQADLAEFALAQAQREVKAADALVAQGRSQPDYSRAEPFSTAAITAFTALAQAHSTKTINVSPTDTLKVTDWLGFSTQPKAGSPLDVAARMAPGTKLPAIAPVSPAEALASLNAGKQAEQRGDAAAALDDYARAAPVDFADQPQALANTGRLALAAKRYDLALQALKTLVEKYPERQVSTGAVDERVVKDWIGTPADHKGDFLAAEALADQINRGKIAYKTMDALVALTGRNPWYSAALALLIFTVVIKVAMTPLTNIQFNSTRKMTAIQPKMKALQEQCKDKPEELNKRMMALYKEEGVNPVGCGATMLIQFPILIALYSVIRLYNFQFRDAYFLWVNPHTASLAPGIIGANLAQPDMILLGLYAVSMFLSQKLTVMPAQDEQQRQQQMMMAYMMPIMFLFVLKTFPSAFVLYWLLFNFFTTWQQWHLLKKNPIPVASPVTSSGSPGSNGTSQTARPQRSPEDAPKPGPKQTPPKRKK
ncbi:MAG TPA: YidC/Oxa1 family membrane protein insertase [Armatimonadota bacterium]|jgi:YidC/Oxa1 family membrane protein insertase